MICFADVTTPNTQTLIELIALIFSNSSKQAKPFIPLLIISSDHYILFISSYSSTRYKAIMKCNSSTSATLAILLFNTLSHTNGFAPQPFPYASSNVHHRAHPPHKNSYLEQLAATPTKADTTEKPPTTTANKETPITSMETTQELNEKQDEAKSLLEKVKQAGTAGAISYALWELGAPQILPILLRMQLFQNSNEIFAWFRKSFAILKDFGESVFRFV